MSRTSLACVFTAVFVLLCTWAAYTQSASPPPMRIDKVKGDLYMVSGEGGNVAAYVTIEGVILVDDMFDRSNRDILAQVKTVTDKPIKYVLNTHQHDDHAGGNDKILPLAEVIAHKNVRTNLVAKKPPFYEDRPGTPIGLPRITFSDETSVFLGGKEVRAHYFGPAHTNGDVIVYFPEVRAIHTGDLFLAGRAPAPPRPPGVSIFIDYGQGGSFLTWANVLDQGLKLDFDTVIPGHGPVSKKEDLVKFRNDLETMRNRLAGLIKQGKSKADIVKTLEDDYGWRVAGCPPSPPTPGCLAIQQVDALIAELKR